VCEKFGCIGVLSLSNFFLHYYFVLHLWLVNFFVIASACGRTSHQGNHVNFGFFLYDCCVLFIVIVIYCTTVIIHWSGIIFAFVLEHKIVLHVLHRSCACACACVWICARAHLHIYWLYLYIWIHMHAHMILNMFCN